MGRATWLIFRGQVLFWTNLFSTVTSTRASRISLIRSTTSPIPTYRYHSDDKISEWSANLSFWAEHYNVLTSFQHRLHHCEQSQRVSWLGPRWSSCLALKIFTSHQPEQAGCHPAWHLDAGGLSRDDQVQLLIGEKERTTWGDHCPTEEKLDVTSSCSNVQLAGYWQRHLLVCCAGTSVIFGLTWMEKWQ